MQSPHIDLTPHGIWTGALGVQPSSLHQRIGLVLGSKNEVERIERYHAEADAGTDKPYVSPLFNERSLYRPEARV